MSAYTQQETQINDADLLIDCLKKKGIKEVEKHDQPVQLTGYRGDKRQDTAEIVIPKRVVGSASNDIGFKKQVDGTYKAIISQYDSGRYNEAWMTDLKKMYAVEKVKKIAKQNGMTLVSITNNANGSIKMQYVQN